MEADNPHDIKLELYKKNIPTDVRDALFHVIDTMSVCVSAAETLFKEKATPEHALAIYDRTMLVKTKPKLVKSKSALPAESDLFSE